ncbi:MAG: ribonuclease R [Bdellovibrionia bacterium]
MKKKIPTLVGTIKRHPDGFGFFIPDNPDHPDVYIPRHSMTGVMTSDKVEIEVYPEKGGERFRGEIIKVVHRGSKKVVGRFFRINDTYGIIRDEGKGWGEDLRIPIADSMNAKDKELVAAEIINYPDSDLPFSGKIVEVIGDSMDPLNDIKRVLIHQNVPVEFSAATLAESKKFGEVPTESDMKGRKDLRPLNLITIDGATAKDFDDAVYCEQNEKGFKLFVAIADVSHYVAPGTAIDKDAYERGTSVYFPNYVVPMLPEVLSNGLCSLNPHVPRLCVVAEMQFDFTGELLNSDFYEAVMESKARVTYGEAQEIIDGEEVAKLAHVKENIIRLSDLAKILMAKRFKEGSLDLEIPETELVIDGAGVPVDIIRSERLFSHRLIEEMMLAANVAVAKFFTEKEVPAIYRIHEEPNEEAIRLLERYLWNFGGRTKLGEGKLQKRLTRALQEFEGKPEAHILHILTLRSMAQAKYHQTNVGHFGLGFENYTHFTSPIRRYPDLIVHRTLKSIVCSHKGYRSMSEDDLATAGTYLSACEQRAAKSERQIHSIKKARFMEKFIGEEFDGMVSSITKFGVFVLLREYDVDGLVRLDDLGNDRFEYDEDNLRLVGKKSKKIIAAGDLMRIQVASADHELGQINFVPVEIIHVENHKKSELPWGSKGKGKPARSQEPRRHSDRDKKSFGTKEKPASRFENKRENKFESEKRSNKDSRSKFGSRSSRDSQFEKSEKPQRDSHTSKGDRSQRGSRFIKNDSATSSRGASPTTKRSDDRVSSRTSEGPNLEVLKMILGPEEFEKVQKTLKEKPALSRKLQYAMNSRLAEPEIPDEDAESDIRRNRPQKQKNNSAGAKKSFKSSNNRNQKRKQKSSKKKRR